jgi:hypothetical protein
MLTGEQVSSLDAGRYGIYSSRSSIIRLRSSMRRCRQVQWKDFDVLILPNGNYRVLDDKNMAEGLKRLGAGRRQADCDAGCGEQLAKGEWGIREKTERGGLRIARDGRTMTEKDDYSLLHRYSDRQRDEVMNSVPGAIFRVELDNTHPLAFRLSGSLLYAEAGWNVYEFIREGGWNVGVIRKDNYVSGFTGNKVKERLKDGLIFGVQDLGRGEGYLYGGRSAVPQLLGEWEIVVLQCGVPGWTVMCVNWSIGLGGR